MQTWPDETIDVERAPGQNPPLVRGGKSTCCLSSLVLSPCPDGKHRSREINEVKPFSTKVVRREAVKTYPVKAVLPAVCPDQAPVFEDTFVQKARFVSTGGVKEKYRQQNFGGEGQDGEETGGAERVAAKITCLKRQDARDVFLSLGAQFSNLCKALSVLPRF